MGIPLGDLIDPENCYDIADSLTWLKGVPTRLSIRAVARLGLLAKIPIHARDIFLENVVLQGILGSYDKDWLLIVK